MPVERILRILQDPIRPPLHAVLDAARDPRIREWLSASGEQHQSLFNGARGAALDEVAPWLVRLPRGCRLLQDIVVHGWGNSWGIFLTSSRSFAEIRRHLRRLLVVRTVDGDQLYFRFYDPRALSRIVPTFNNDQLRAFMGEDIVYFYEPGDGSGVLECRGVGEISAPVARSV